MVGDWTPPAPVRVGELHVAYHSLHISDDAQLLPGIPGMGDLLVKASGTQAVVLTGIHTGVVGVEVRPLLARPADVELAEWEEIAEVSIESGTGNLQIFCPSEYSEINFSSLTVAGPGSYRLRVHARGRAANPDGVAFEPSEFYLIVAWPAPTAPTVVHKELLRG